MKRILPFIFMLIFPVSAFSQLTIPNSGFEDWITGNNFYPKTYNFSSNRENFFRTNLPFNMTRSTDAYHGTYAVKLETVASAKDTAGGYFVNSAYTDGNNWHGGIPYNEKPKGIRGYYKSNIVTGDSALIVVSFSKAGTNIGMYFKKMGGVKSTYTLFDFEFKPALTQTPDSVVFGATSSDLLVDKARAGSTFLVDSVSFTGVTGQPANLYGDFEVWENDFLYKPMSWYSEEEGTARISDAHSGNYGIELRTFPGNENNTVIARSGRISTGYYSNACNCLRGGYPYTLKKDTLVLYYKYIPVMSDDSASVGLSFKKNGVWIFYAGAKLQASAVYKKFEIPFDIPGIAPDSVVVEIQSSLWNHKAISYAGAVLKVDDINFRSQMLPLGIRKESSTTGNRNINIYPNPTSGKFSVRMPDNRTGSENMRIEVLNITGQKVLSSYLSTEKSDFDIAGLPKGLYFAKIYDGDKISIIKIVKR